ncbi:hypothetical protein [Streptomyces scabiei]|uniref:hypothetical protein n=1 Tax=Streptomyces scabiei TaxID=1930 RepID=UPI0029B44539|nr:hypothetical protein [Streptomyces scabiei]MDX3279070.1 hypothetical protein [Streptomyces scabiei]MDX3279077.1 hypothetical protein [Streptomyces scabiei]
MKNPKATAIEATVLISSGVVASVLGTQLADRGVGTAAILTAVLAVLTASQYFANQLTQGLRTTLYACPTKGCAVSIRAKDVTDAEQARLRAYATDHTKHGNRSAR